jgi:Domain of unknown function (DUF1992)
MEFLNSLIEERIHRAILAGDFNDLPGQGKPLQFNDDLLVPLDMRAALRVLKNSSCTAGYPLAAGSGRPRNYVGKHRR